MSKKLPEGWKIVKLEDIADIKSGGTPSRSRNEYWNNGDIPWIKISDIKEKYINNSEEFITTEGLGNSSTKLFKKGTILFTIFATLGEVGILNIEATTNQAIAGIEVNKDIVNKEYLYYFLKSLKEKIERNGRGVAQKNINLSILRSYDILLPPLEEQERIVSILEKAENAIEKRVESIKLLDELVKSRFIDMFDKGNYPIVKAEDVCEYITKGTTPKGNEIFEDYADGLIPYLKVYNLSFDGTMLFNEKPQYVKSEIHNGFLARSKVYPNDVLMNIVGPPLGKFSIVPDTFKEWNINQAMAIFRATDKIKPIFLLHALKQPNVLRPFIDSAVGVRQQNLSLLQCRNLEIPLPPIELQNKFVEFVKQVDKLKFEMENSLKELEDNFNSLMQKAFNGEL